MCSPIDSSVPDGLTMEEMQLRFQEVREHFKTVPGGIDDATVCRNLLATRNSDLHLARSAVRESSLHGRGLFALRDLAQGELITFYPGDALLIWKDSDRSPDRDVGVLFGAHVLERDPERVLSEGARGFEVQVSETTSLVGDPELCDDQAYLGHMCNDGSMCSSPEERASYEQESASASNAAFIGIEGCHFSVQATRAIKAGAEILVSYGAGYWLSRNGFDGMSGYEVQRPNNANAMDKLRATTQRAKPKKTSAKKPKKRARPKSGNGGGGFGFGGGPSK